MYNNSKGLIVSGIAVLFSLNAMAAGGSAPENNSPSTDTGAKPEARYKSQQEIRQEMRDHWQNMTDDERAQVRKKMKDHWEKMTPQEREASRQEMLEHFKNMSPEELKQFKRDMGKTDDMPASDPAGANQRSTVNNTLTK